MPHEMLGFIDAAGNYHRTPFRDAYEHGGIYTFDEVDRSDPVALLAVNPHLANGVATFPDGQIKRHKDCLIICTANTWGNGANADYCGATKLDAAFMSRFPAGCPGTSTSLSRCRSPATRPGRSASRPPERRRRRLGSRS
jgi:cobaltochelatase CobS